MNPFHRRVRYIEDPLDVARGHAMKAMRRGALATAEHWHKLATRELAMQLNMARLADSELANEKTEKRTKKALDLLEREEAIRRRGREDRAEIERRFRH